MSKVKACSRKSAIFIQAFHLRQILSSAQKQLSSSSSNFLQMMWQPPQELFKYKTYLPLQTILYKLSCQRTFHCASPPSFYFQCLFLLHSDWRPSLLFLPLLFLSSDWLKILRKFNSKLRTII